MRGRSESGSVVEERWLVWSPEMRMEFNGELDCEDLET